jgi:hypothetical protein
LDAGGDVCTDSGVRVLVRLLDNNPAHYFSGLIVRQFVSALGVNVVHPRTAWQHVSLRIGNRDLIRLPAMPLREVHWEAIDAEHVRTALSPRNHGAHPPPRGR